MRKMKGALLITVVTLASEPTRAQPPNEVYSFDVIADTVTGQPGCEAGCPVTVPYHLATLTVTHKAFAPNHAASLTHPPTVDNGVVSLVFVPRDVILTFFPGASELFRRQHPGPIRRPG